MPRHRGADRGEPSAAGDAAADERGFGRARREVFRALRGDRASLDTSGAPSASFASAASLFDPLGAAAGRTAGVRHAVSLVRRVVDRREGVRRLDLLEEPRPPAYARDRARVSVLASRPAGGEGAFERRAFFGRWNDGESLGVDEELPSHGLIGRKSGERGARAKSTFARPSGRTRPTPRRRTKMRAFCAKAPDRRAVSPLLATS